MKKIVALCCGLLIGFLALAEDGYRLWLRYAPIDNAARLSEYRTAIRGIRIIGNSPVISAAREELELGLKGMLGKAPAISQSGLLIVGTGDQAGFAQFKLQEKLKQAGEEGFVISNVNNSIVITANTDNGVLYGVFHFFAIAAIKSIHQKYFHRQQPAHKTSLVESLG